MQLQQMMELLLAMREDMKANQEKMEANRKINKEEMNANTKTMLAEMLEKLDTDSKTWREEMEASMNAWRKETMACQERAEAHLEYKDPTSPDMKASQEATETETFPETMQSIEEHEEIPKENAAVMLVEEPRKRRRDRKLEARCRKKQKERTQNKDGSRKSLVAADRRKTHRTKVARRKKIVIGRNLIRRHRPKKNPARAQGAEMLRSCYT
jgi:hypothetical protein